MWISWLEFWLLLRPKEGERQWCKSLTSHPLRTRPSSQGQTSLSSFMRLPTEDGRLGAWNQSALEAARLAMDHWIRVGANQSLGA
jgi:hypothetical protein